MTLSSIVNDINVNCSHVIWNSNLQAPPDGRFSLTVCMCSLCHSHSPSLSSCQTYHLCCCRCLGPRDLQGVTEPKIDGSESPSTIASPGPAAGLSLLGSFSPLVTCVFIPVIAQTVIHNFFNSSDWAGALCQPHLVQWVFFIPCTGGVWSSLPALRACSSGPLCLVPDPGPCSLWL